MRVEFCSTKILLFLGAANGSVSFVDNISANQTIRKIPLGKLGNWDLLVRHV
jgi:hypothetical protein